MNRLDSDSSFFNPEEKKFPAPDPSSQNRGYLHRRNPPKSKIDRVYRELQSQRGFDPAPSSTRPPSSSSGSRSSPPSQISNSSSSGSRSSPPSQGGLSDSPASSAVSVSPNSDEAFAQPIGSASSEPRHIRAPSNGPATLPLPLPTHRSAQSESSFLASHSLRRSPLERGLTYSQAATPLPVADQGSSGSRPGSDLEDFPSLTSNSSTSCSAVPPSPLSDSSSRRFSYSEIMGVSRPTHSVNRIDSLVDSLPSLQRNPSVLSAASTPPLSRQTTLSPASDTVSEMDEWAVVRYRRKSFAGQSGKTGMSNRSTFSSPSASPLNRLCESTSYGGREHWQGIQDPSPSGRSSAGRSFAHQRRSPSIEKGTLKNHTRGTPLPSSTPSSTPSPLPSRRTPGPVCRIERIDTFSDDLSPLHDLSARRPSPIFRFVLEPSPQSMIKEPEVSQPIPAPRPATLSEVKKKWATRIQLIPLLRNIPNQPRDPLPCQLPVFR